MRLRVESDFADRHPPGAGAGAGDAVHRADKLGNEQRVRAAVNFGRGADLLDDAVVHDHDAVGHGQRFLLVMRDHDGGDAEPPLQRFHLDPQVGAHPGVQRRQRFVQQQQARRSRQRAGEGDALLLAAGQLRRVFAFLPGQVDQRQQLGHAALDVGAFEFLVLQTERDVARHGQVGEQRVRLKHDAEVALGRRQLGDVAPGLPHPPGGLDVEAGDGAQQRGFAAAGRPEEADELALVDGQRHFVQRREIAEDFAQAVDAQERRARRGGVHGEFARGGWR